MKQEPFIIERTYHATPEKVWKALTDKDEMKEWYFNIESFEPKVGFEFTFEAGNEDKRYKHICKITDVEPGKKLRYSWRYEGVEGISFVTFELFPEGGSTKVKLTHEGLESFKTDHPDFKRESFMGGWTFILGTSLKNYIEK
ncbi:MAG: SRPBCC domain-containing protein [Ginsengibacter sp.]